MKISWDIQQLAIILSYFIGNKFCDWDNMSFLD